jgi:hypothetical protein
MVRITKQSYHIIYYTKLYSGSFSCIVQTQQMQLVPVFNISFTPKMRYTHLVRDYKVMHIITGVQPYRSFMETPY